jgi:riboflavin kinase/FMN adenylyltransferase
MIIREGDYRAWEPLDRDTVATVGVYDGVHLGHRHVFEKMAGTGLPISVVTFRDHPARVIAPYAAPRLLAPIARRLELLAEVGVYAVGVVDFDQEFMQMSPERFVTDVVVGKMRAKVVAVGEDFRFGYRQQGDVDLLRRMGPELGFTVEAVGILEDKVPIRSTVIRMALAEGDVGTAARLLGRPHRVIGTVGPGESRGRSIGFPTANLEVAPNLALPRSGVYAVRVCFGGVEHPGVANLGTRPTFDGTEQVLEAHVLDYAGNLYGKEVAVDFIARLRDEKKFSSVADLIDSINDDVATARRILRGQP